MNIRMLYPLIMRWLLVGVLFLVGCGQTAAGPATATPTWPAQPSPTPTIVPPSPIPPTATPAPETLPGPTPTLVVTPTPEQGFYGDSALGFSFTYPVNWIAEPNESGIVVQDEELGIWMSGYSELLAVDETVDDILTELYGFVLDEPDAVEVLSDTTIPLAGDVEARVVEFTEPDSFFQTRVTLAAREQRLFILLFFAPTSVFERFPETINALSAGLTIETPRPYGISRQQALFQAGSQPRTIDPAKTHGSAGSTIGAVFSGLVMLDENLQVVPDLAETWTVDDEGTVFTFYLRPEAAFHNGKPVTAQDVKFSWERAADPATESDTVATYLGDIVGVKAVIDGETEEIDGIEVIDDHTLQVTIDAPKPYFLAKLTYPVAFIVDEQNVQTPDWEHQPNGSGPFRLRTWEDDNLIILDRNDNFYLEPAQLEHVVTLMYQDVSIRMYENDEVDIAGVGLNNLERMTDPDNPLSEEVSETAALCTSRLIFDVTQPPFDDPLVRQAFAYAIDRQELTEGLLKNRARPAQSILPPGMPGYSDDITAPTFDPERAQSLLAESSYGHDLPEIVYTTSGFGGSLGDYDQALLEMWRIHLGIEVTVEQLEPINYVTEVRENHGQIIDSGWCADYPDPENFLDVLYHSDSVEQNLGGYSNPEVDALLEEARVEQDVEQRLALYRQVEQVIIDDAPDILLHQSNGGLVLLKPYVKNYPLTPIFPASAWRTLSVTR